MKNTTKSSSIAKFEEGSNRDNSFKVAIFGLGRIGLPLALVLAQAGYQIFGVEKSAVKQKMIKEGVMPFKEEGADALLKKYTGKKLFITDAKEALTKARVVVLCVGTTIDEYKNPVLDQVYAVFSSLLPHLRENTLIIIRSTLNPRASLELIDYLEKKLARKLGDGLFYAYVPERTIEGKAIREMKTLPLIIGVEDPKSAEMTAAIFKKVAPRVLITDTLSAEITKLSLNTYRYINFAVANELTMISQHFNRDIHHILYLANTDYPRGGIPDPGFAAGPCLFKDGFYLKHGTPYNALITASLAINENLPMYLISLLKEQRVLEGAKVALLGLAFKKNVDDPRDSLAFRAKKIFKTYRARVYSHDPYIQSNKIERVLRGADIVFVSTDHDHYKEFGLENIKKLAHPDALVCDIWNTFGEGKIVFPLAS